MQAECNRDVIIDKYCTRTMSPPVAKLSAQRADLLRYVRRRVSDAALSEDIVQEAFLRFLVYEAKADKTVSNVAALLRRISLNLARDHFRYAGRMSVVELSEDIPCPQPSIQQQMERRQLIEIVMGVLKEMPPLRRDVFVRRRLHGQSAGEVVEALGLSASAVSHHMARALVDLHLAISKIERRGAPVRD
ncbi:MAG: RNA polymerase sigma factor [Sphingomonadales bacterium]|nr:RNA polymerase sigma factor [Sphingomonadales bacterium]